MRSYLAVTALIFLSFNCQELADRYDPDILDAMSEIETVNGLENFIDLNVADAYAKNEKTYQDYVAGQAELDQHLETTDATVGKTAKHNLNIRQESRDRNQRSNDDFTDL